MVRLYIQLASSTDKDWNPRKQATEKEVQESAKRIMKPYYIEWEHVEWYSVYPIGQGIAEKYTLDHRIFLGGDCCHTHSVGLQFLVRPAMLTVAAQSRSRYEHRLPRCSQPRLEDPSR